MKRLYSEEENNMSHLTQSVVSNDPDFISIIKMGLSNKVTEILEDGTSADLDKRIATLTSSQLMRVLPDVVNWAAGADLDASSTDVAVDAQINTVWSTSLAYRVGAIELPSA